MTTTIYVNCISGTISDLSLKITGFTRHGVSTVMANEISFFDVYISIFSYLCERCQYSSWSRWWSFNKWNKAHKKFCTWFIKKAFKYYFKCKQTPEFVLLFVANKMRQWKTQVEWKTKYFIRFTSLNIVYFFILFFWFYFKHQYTRGASFI